MISTFNVYRARKCHTACSYRVTSLRSKNLALKSKEQEMKQRWLPKILLIQDAISLVPAAVENMMLYRSMRARQEAGLDPLKYFHKAGNLMGRMPILLIAGDFLQIRPAKEISLADMQVFLRKSPNRLQTERSAAQEAVKSIETVIHLKSRSGSWMPSCRKSQRPCACPHPLNLCRRSTLTSCALAKSNSARMNWQRISSNMVMSLESIGRTLLAAWWRERAYRDAQELDVPLFWLQAADRRHSKKSQEMDKQLTHQLLTVPNPHRTGKLQGMLLLHENMIVRLADVLAPQLGLAKDKLAVVVKVDLHHEDQKRLERRGHPLLLPFIPPLPSVAPLSVSAVLTTFTAVCQRSLRRFDRHLLSLLLSPPSELL